MKCSDVLSKMAKSLEILPKIGPPLINNTHNLSHWRSDYSDFHILSCLRWRAWNTKKTKKNQKGHQKAFCPKSDLDATKKRNILHRKKRLPIETKLNTSKNCDCWFGWKFSDIVNFCKMFPSFFFIVRGQNYSERTTFQYRLPIKGTVTQNICSLKSVPKGCKGLWNNNYL